ncbi:MAG: nicotinamide mononucleotide transporter [Lachnospiraceae bacterium]|nr:nicotinamide mononucleotide transporter [Lachnospiraceae bacterium]
MGKLLKSQLNYFSKNEKRLWSFSVLLILGSFLIFDRENYLTLAASLIGVTSLIYDAKGNPFGQVLMIVFSLLYGMISYTFAYYGEMATYLGMTAPMSAFALVSWLKNPYQGNKSEVEINSLSGKEISLMALLTAAVTVLFYFILDAFHTANLLPSTLSVTTSFMAVYLTYKRSAFFALAYAANDVVLIVLWALAALSNPSYLSVLTCFAVFFFNDAYTFINWTRMQKRQKAAALN